MQFWKAHMLIYTLIISAICWHHKVAMWHYTLSVLNSVTQALGLLHGYTWQKCSFMLEAQERSSESLQTGFCACASDSKHSTTAKVLVHLAVSSENWLTDAENVITGFYMKTRLMQKSQWVVIY